eukprot:NODE_853_length_1133_cov_145.048893_g693_i0.p2 GENE.NODE_853_length_1133_cov_145.048893_g693_i0~~NODE_853_length_1133_cov_145.048893_g693_i0.p2  ORF type:complete len:154 (-),score=46.60 NODE_853_length_1133_cov_145.048893_g693_i0:282-743(-)
MGAPGVEWLAQKGLKVMCGPSHGLQSVARDFVDKNGSAERVGKLYDTLKLTFCNPHYFSSVVQSVRQFPLDGLNDVYGKLGCLMADRGIRCLVIWGDQDAVIKPSLGPTAVDLLGGPSLTKLVVIPEAGHSAFLEKPEVVATTFLEWIEVIGG